MALTSGKYVARTEREVFVWPVADANGDGAPVWVSRRDELGREVERVRGKDIHGQEIFEYLPPDGFTNLPSFDHTDNYVLTGERGEIFRQPNGEAVNIKPGQAIVLNPDGSIETLTDEYAQYVFSSNHDPVGTVSKSKKEKVSA